MSNLAISKSSGFNREIANESSSLFDKYQSTLTAMLVFDANLERVKELPKDTFDATLWLQLNREGPAKYHWLVYEELVPGYLWVQEDDWRPQIAIHWSAEPGWIYKAYLTGAKNEVVVESYIACILDTSCKYKEVSIETFQSLINNYLVENANPEKEEFQPLVARQFQRQLERIPIIFKATRSACEQLSHLGGKFWDDVTVVLGVDGKEGENFNPEKGEGLELVTISKCFIAGRFASIHDQEGNPEVTSEPVAPVIRTKEALRAVRKLRKMELDDNEGDSIFALDPERSVTRIMDEKAVADKSLKDLRAWFVLVLGEFNIKSHEFQVLEPKKILGKESLELSVDFQEDTWKLQSQFFEKV